MNDNSQPPAFDTECVLALSSYCFLIDSDLSSGAGKSVWLRKAGLQTEITRNVAIGWLAFLLSNFGGQCSDFDPEAGHLILILILF